MTTAHRPTWKAAVGKAQEGGWNAGGAVSSKVSVLDIASHTKLKHRKGSQVIEDKRAILAQSLLELEQAEQHVIPKRQVDPKHDEESRLKFLKQTAEVDVDGIKDKYDDEESDLDESDADDSDSDDDDDSDDDEAALQAELAKIRAEKEAQKQAAEKEAEDAELAETALVGNPLLAKDGSGTKKRRWNEDVVFRNQAKNAPEEKKRFINDTVRNDFHKRFMNKFIK